MPIVDVIGFEGDPNVLVWKSPITDFNAASQLSVDENHEALVLIEGRSEVFGPGRHTLDPQNYFGLNWVQRMATGGKTIFPCKVYFFNKVQSMDLLWGTADKLPVMDPEYDIMLNLRIRGNMSFQIDNVKQFAEKFSGFMDTFTNDQFGKKFRGIIATAASDQIAKVMVNARIGFFNINAHLTDISQLLFASLTGQFEEYGVRLTKFNLETITSDNEDTAEFKAAKSQAASVRIGAHAAAESRAIQGFTWSDEQKANILSLLASNEGTPGTFMGGVLGLNMASDMTSPMGNVMSSFFNGPNAAGPGDEGPSDLGAASASPTPLFPTGGGTAGVPPMPPQTPPPAPSAMPQPAAAASEPQHAPQCSQCHNAVDQSWKVCPFCGTPLAKPDCPSCGHDVDPSWKVCPFCGTQLH
ncbi:SPFH domain-containing protein [Bifidobacterium pseudolongum]|uniref:SPFH domain-containing protein n=1 Tax=Bifidobacterium pseudolongum TaxID=1694 RepID=UPI0010DBFEFF|nr:SPFH domain-containing protein [Bifidobacterium pseudolongum]RYQ44137.1 antifreeze protein type I [Bifidobacterium pseudolongum subsp. globosum]